MAYVEPTFNDAPIFGVGAVLTTAVKPPRLQWDSFPGINGSSFQRQGTDGFTTSAEGLHLGGDLDELAAVQQTIRGLVNTSTLGVLVNTMGDAYGQVLWESFEPVGPIRPHDPGGYPDGVCQQYRATLRHLI